METAGHDERDENDVLADLRRHPDVEAPNLHAVDASDRLILDEGASALAGAADGSEVVVIGDHHGALTLGAITRHGLSGVRTHQDRLLGEQALRANADRLGLGGFTHHGLTPQLVAGARVVLLQLPRSLDALDEIAGLVADHADPEVVVVAGGRVKHMTTAMNDVLGATCPACRPGWPGRSRGCSWRRRRGRAPSVRRPGGPRVRSTPTSTSWCAPTGVRSRGPGSTSARVPCSRTSTSSRCRSPPRSTWAAAPGSSRSWPRGRVPG